MTDISLTLPGNTLEEDGNTDLSQVNLLPEGDLLPPSSLQSADQNNLTAAMGAIVLSDVDPKTDREGFDNEFYVSLQQILEGRENEIRANAARKRQVEEDRASNRVLLEELDNPNPESATIIQGLFELQDQTAAREQEHALEQLAIEKLEDMAIQNPDQARAVLRGYIEGDVNQQVQDLMIKKMAFNRMVDRLAQEREDQSTFRSVMDFATGFITDAVKGSGVYTDTSVLHRLFNPGRTDVEDRMRFWYGTDVDTFLKELPLVEARLREVSGVLFDNRTKILSDAYELLSANEEQIVGKNLLAAIDFADLGIIGVGSAAKLFKSPSQLAKLAGARDLAAEMPAATLTRTTDTTGAAAASMPGGSAVAEVAGIEQSIGDALPSALVPTPDLAVGVSGDVSAIIAKQEEAIREVTKMASTGGLTADEMEAAAEAAVKRFEAETDLSIADYKVSDYGASFGATKLDLFIGKKTGDGGFATKGAAKQQASRRGIENYDVVEDTSGQFFIRVKTDVGEAGYYSPLNENDIGKVTPIGAFLRNPRGYISERLTQDAGAAVLGHTFITQEVVPALAAPISALSRKELDSLKTVALAGHKQEKWFTKAELDFEYQRVAKRAPTGKEVAAYYSLKNINDLDWAIRNAVEYHNQAMRGLKSVRVKGVAHDFDTGRVLGKEKRPGQSLEEVIKSRVYNAVTGEHMLPNQNRPFTTAKELEDYMEREGLTIVELDRVMFDQADEPIGFILARKEDVTVTNLDAAQMPYRAGGHRYYEGKIFVKQARTVTSKLSGTEYTVDPLTHIVAKSRAEAKAWAEKMERMRQAYNARASMTDDAIQAAFDESPTGSISSVEDFDKFVKEGRIDANNPFEVVFDQENPPAMNVGEKPPVTLGSIEPRDGFSSWLATNKTKRFAGKRGDHLKNPQDELATILDPLEVATRAIENATNTAAFGQFKRAHIERWVKGVGEHLLAKEGSTPEEAFFFGSLKPSAPRALRWKFEAERGAIMRLINARTKEGRFFEDVRRGVAEWVDGVTKGKYSETTAFNHMSTDPLKALRGFAYHTKLGLFDPGQLFLQTQTAASMIAMEPTIGLKAATAFPATRMALVNQTTEFRKFLGTKLRGLHGMEADDFENMVEALRINGFHHVAGEQLLLDMYSEGFSRGLGGRIRKKVGEGSKFFFVEAERTNRIMAWNMAWRKFDAVHGFKPKSPADIAWVRAKAEDYTMDMIATSRAAWQRGALAVPTQFASYPARLIENIMPAMLGGSRRFSGGEKARLLAGQIFLFGMGGTLGKTLGDDFADYIVENYEQATGKPANEHVYTMMTQGFWDMLFNAATDTTTDFSSRAGGSGFFQGVYRDLMAGDKSFVEVLMGPGGMITADVYREVMPTINLILSSQRPVTADEWLEVSKGLASDVSQEISSLGRGTRAYLAMKTGLLYDSNLKEYGKAVSSDPFFLALGIPLKEQTVGSELYLALRHEDEALRDIGKLVAKNIRRAHKNPELADMYGRYNKMLVGTLDTFQMEKVNQVAEHELGPGFTYGIRLRAAERGKEVRETENMQQRR